MPRLSASAAVRANSDKFSLCLNVRHRLAVGSVSDIAHQRSGFPDDVDVVLATNLILTLSGKMDNVKISSESIVESAIAHHLSAYLELVCLLIAQTYIYALSSLQNASRLGLHTVSSAYVDDDGLSKSISRLSQERVLSSCIKSDLVRLTTIT
jgi:hypothetical protein